MQTFHPTLSLAAAALLIAGQCLAQANDDCSGAISASLGVNGPFSNTGSTTSAPAWPCGAGGNDVWFSYFSTGAGSLVADTCGSTYDSTLEVFSGTCGSLVSLACNDDSCGNASVVTVPVTACTTYYIRVGGWASSTGTFNLNLTGPTGSCSQTPATVVSQGVGCGATFTSFHESLTAGPGFDLTGKALTMIPAAGGYVVLSGPGSLMPVGSIGTPTTVVLGDDTSAPAGGSNGLTIGSNCWVALAAGNSTGFTPSVAVLLSNPATAFYSWTDLNPGAVGSGQVRYEEAGPLSLITYDGVYAYGTTLPCFVQFLIDVSSASCTITWGTMNPSTTNGGPVLVGYSPGGPSTTPASTDLSALIGLPLITYAADFGAQLLATAVGRPVQGALATNFDVTTSNLPVTALAHVGVIGLSNPGLPLGILLGATDCFLNASADILVGPVLLPPASVTWTSLNLPALPPNFSGFQFYAMGAVLGTPLNSAIGGLGLLTSNSLLCTVGDI